MLNIILTVERCQEVDARMDGPEGQGRDTLLGALLRLGVTSPVAYSETINHSSSKRVCDSDFNYI